METNLLIDKINTIEKILENNEGKNDTLIKFALNEIKSMILNNDNKQKDDLNNAEVTRLKKIIEEKDIQINKLNNKLNTLNITPQEKTKLGCKHYKDVNVFVKCSECNDFFPCYICHNNNIKGHSFKYGDTIRCRYCHKIFKSNLDYCPGCNIKKLLV